MKKYFQILLFVLLVCTFTAYCSAMDKSLADIDDNLMRESSAAEISSIDVDMTKLSSTMAFAELYNIMVNADDYLGKTVKIRGSYNAMLSDLTNQYCHLVIIGDATSCCEIGIEFVWNGSHEYPEDYPEVYKRIEVVGVLSCIEVLGQTRYYLAVDDISIL
jgi:hypothetical protein